MAKDHFFDGGWCWMSHPDRNIGNAIPVFMYEADGTRYYVPLDPSDGGELVWDERDAEWEMVQGPIVDADRIAVIDQLCITISQLADALETANRTVGGPAQAMGTALVKTAREILKAVKP